MLAGIIVVRGGLVKGEYEGERMIGRLQNINDIHSIFFRYFLYDVFRHWDIIIRIVCTNWRFYDLFYR